MPTLTHDAQSHLAQYLRQMRTALRGHPSVDPDDIERDVLGHIDAELAGRPEPIDEGDLRPVLERLGAPSQWVPADEQREGAGSHRTNREALPSVLAAQRLRVDRFLKPNRVPFAWPRERRLSLDSGCS